MQSKQNLKREMQETVELSGLVNVYQEIAATKIRTVKRGVEDSRNYWESLHTAMLEVGADLTVEGESKGTAIIWLAAEQGLYGGVIQSTRRSLLTAINENPSATIYIAGNRGQQLFREWWPKKPYETLSLPDEDFMKTELAQLVASLPQFTELVVIYGKMVNLLTQEPLVKRWHPVGAGQSSRELSAKQRKYLYEPETEVVSQFLGTQVTTGILTQLAQENKLAKLAARVMSLEDTMTQVEKNMLGMGRQMRRIKSRENDKKQQARITHQHARRTP